MNVYIFHIQVCVYATPVQTIDAHCLAERVNKRCAEMRTNMKILKKFLAVSFSVMTLLSIAFIYNKVSNQPQNYASIMKYVNSAATQAVLNFDDALQKVTKSESGTSTLSVSGDLKSDLKVTDAKGNLVADSANTQDTSTNVTKAATTNTANGNFPEKIYPYRAMLTSAQQLVYDQVYDNAIKLTASFNISSAIDSDGLTNIMTAIFNDHPEIFWIDTSYSYGYTTKGTVVSVTLEFNDTASNISASKNKFNNAANTIIAKTSGLANDLEKEKMVYKSLMNIAIYDENSLLNQSAYSAMVNGSSVCAGYSRAFQYIMMQIDIPCYFCSGYANNGYHAWNIVKLNDIYYNVDLSWDDTIGDAGNTYSYEYFNIADSVFSKTHTRRDLSVKLPLCK